MKFRSYVLESIIYYALKDNPFLYTESYIDILKQVIKHLYNKTSHKVLDIPGYDYIDYELTNEQWERIQ